jgi:uracil-DNA glycosylase family 4
MPLLPNRGSPLAPIWIVCERPAPSDIPRGYLWSGSLASVYDKMLREAGIKDSDVYITCRRPNTDHPEAIAIVENDINNHKPPFILLLDEVAGFYLDELKVKGFFQRGQLQKYAGSFLSSSSFNHSHYAIPMYGPQFCVADWTERNISTYIDLQKLRDELAYYRSNMVLQSLPARELKFHDMPLDELLSYIDRFKNVTHVSNDIENPVYRSELYKPHPGYPLLVGLADSPSFGISFKLFRESIKETRILWRSLYELFHTVITVGQNFLNYDWFYECALGFDVPLDKVQDTLIRHHILWPELSHKLQFMTRQYTREPYYKDEGQHYGLKAMDRYRRYNALDACVTMEVFLGQEEEFKQRSHLA